MARGRKNSAGQNRQNRGSMSLSEAGRKGAAVRNRKRQSQSSETGSNE